MLELPPAKTAGLLFAIALALGAGAAVAATDELLNDEERAWLAASDRPFVVGLESSYRPYAYIDETGQIAGMARDYLDLLTSRLGIRFATREFRTFVEMLEAAQGGEIDIVPFIIAAPEKSSYLDFTDPVYTTVDRILARDEFALSLDMEDLAGMRVGIIEGYAIQAELSVNRTDIDLVPMASELAGVRALSVGQIDALIIDSGGAAYHIQEEGIANLRIVGEAESSGPQTFGTRKDLPMLGSILQKGLASITPAERAAIENRWVNLGGIDPTEFEKLSERLVIAAVVLGILALFAFLWIFSLRRLVARRTLALREELSQRQRVEAASGRLAQALQQSAEFVLIIGEWNRIEYANLAFLGASGEEDVTGRAFELLAVEEDREKLSGVIDSLDAGGVWRGTVNLKLESGLPMHTAMTITPIENDSSVVDGFVVTARDTSYEEQLEARLRHSEKLSALGTLAGGIAHDFNNLLVPIVSGVDLIREECTPAAYPFLDAISAAGERARELVQRILSFSRQRDSSQEIIDLGQEVVEAGKFLRSLLPATIDIHTNIQESKPIRGDRTQVHQILLNLGTNASDAMPTGGDLHISVFPFALSGEDPLLPELQSGEYALLEVTDSGMGMDAATQKRIFEPYFTSKPQGKGTGLGLATVHGIVQANGGAIYIDSTPEGGSSFRIFFPAADAPIADGIASVIQHPHNGSGQRILVVDDDKVVLDAVGSILGRLGYVVRMESDPFVALGAIRDKPDAFDAVLTDLTMPGLSGTLLADKIQQVHPDIPVVLMSGNSNLLDDGARVHVSKPLITHELAECLRLVLGSR